MSKKTQKTKKAANLKKAMKNSKNIQVEQTSQKTKHAADTEDRMPNGAVFIHKWDTYYYDRKERGWWMMYDFKWTRWGPGYEFWKWVGQGEQGWD